MRRRVHVVAPRAFGPFPGGGAVLCPGVEIGEEAFVGAGAVVVRDVVLRTLVVGNPARELRAVPDEEFLDR